MRKQRYLSVVQLKKKLCLDKIYVLFQIPIHFSLFVYNKFKFLQKQTKEREGKPGLFFTIYI